MALQNECKKIWQKIPEESPDINVPFWTMWSDTFSRVEISYAYLFKMARTLALRPEIKHSHSGCGPGGSNQLSSTHTMPMVGIAIAAC